jgi:ABC-2 type transport system permease protein
MARLFVQLKLRILGNALRSSARGKVSFLISTTIAVLVAAGTFVVLASLRGQAAPVDLTTVIFTLFAFGWLILPLLAFGLDSTLDPATLSLYPLRTRPLAVGLLAASATGAWPAANVIGLLGVTIGLARGAPGELVAVAAVLLQVLFSMVLARFVITGMAGLLRSRRGKDFAVFLFIPIVACYELFTQVVPRLATSGQLTAASFAGVDPWLRWLPPGLAAHAIWDASHGRPGAAVLRLALLAAIIVALAWLWVRVLGHALVSPDASTQSAQVHAGALPLARYGLRGAVTARVWIYQRREPMMLTSWGIVAVIMVAASISALLGPQRHPGVLLLGSVLGAAFVGVFHANAIGVTGPAFIFEATALSSRRALRDYLAGQTIVLGVIAAPLLVAVSLGLAALAGNMSYGLVGVAVDLAGLGAALGLISIFTVAVAFPARRRIGSPTLVAAEGYGSYGFASAFGNILGVAAATAPVIIIGLTTSTAPGAIRGPALLLGSAAYGLALAWAGVRVAAGEAEAKLPELCQIAIRSTP